MKKLVYFSTFSILVLTACNGSEAPENDTPETPIDTTTVEVDTGFVVEPIDTAIIDSSGYIDETASISNQIEEEYGEQWEFCDCVVKNDSANNAILETEDDAVMDEILARMEVIDQHCKEMLTTPNTTPDERAKHERKVNKCLKGK